MEADARYDLFRRCYEEAILSRREQTQIPSPLYDMGTIYDPWPMYDEFYNGDHWSRLGALPSWKSRPVDNKCFQAVESYTTQLTDSKPKVGFYPREVDDEPLAKLTQSYFDYWWEIARGSTAVYLAVKDSRKFGVGWLRLEWDAEKKQQCLYAVHPESVLVDPDCTADNFDPTYVVYEYTAQVGDLKAAYPKADWESFKAEQDLSTSVGAFDRILKRIGLGNTEVSNPAKSTICYEFWLKDPDRVEWDEYNEALGVSVTKRKKRYPNGRLLTIAGGIVLDDCAAEYKHGQCTLTPIHAYPESGKFYCASDIANILPSQILLNRVNQLLFDGTVRAGGGIVLVNPSMGLNKDGITNAVVQVREVKDVNAALRMEQFPSPPRHLFDFGTYLSRISDDMAGIHDISRGVFTPGNKTVAEVDVLSESDKTRVRMAARVLSAALQRVGTQWLSNVAQFESKKRVLRVVGDDGDTMSVEFDGGLLRKKGDKDEEWSLSPLDISVDDSSTLPARQREKEQLAMELHARQVIDSEELLRIIDWPNYKAVLQRITPPAPPQGAPQGPPPDMAGGAPPMPEGPMPPELMAMLAQGGGMPPNQMQPDMQMGAPDAGMMPVDAMPPDMPVASDGMEQPPTPEMIAMMQALMEGQ